MQKAEVWVKKKFNLFQSEVSARTSKNNLIYVDNVNHN